MAGQLSDPPHDLVPNAARPLMEPVFVDDALLVLDKPSGLLAVPGRGADKQDALSTQVQRLYPDALIVHRLDMATSGLMLMARGPRVQRSLSRAFADREIHKRYIAVADGCLQAPADAPDGWGVIDLPIALDWPKRPLRVIDTKRGKPSVTHWRVLGWERGNDTTRVMLEPVTGRSHQLRVHLQALGHAIVGDALYASAPVQAKSSRLLLHACALTLTHPVTGKTMAFASPAPF